MASVFSKEFTKTVAALLKARCAGGNRTTREAIVAALGDGFGLDDSNLAVMVSLSLSTGAVQGFEARRGRTGGIYPVGVPNEKRAKPVVEAAPEPTPEPVVAEAAPEPVAEPVAEVAPEVASEPVSEPSPEPASEPVVEG